MLMRVVLLLCVMVSDEPVTASGVHDDTWNYQNDNSKEEINDIDVNNLGLDDGGEARMSGEQFRRAAWSYSPRSARTFSSDQIDAFNQGLHRKRPKFIGKRTSVSDCENLADEEGVTDTTFEYRCKLIHNENLEKKSRKFVGKRGRKFVGKRSDGEDFESRLVLLPISSSLDSEDGSDDGTKITGLKLEEQSKEDKRSRKFVGKRGRMFVGKRGRMFVGKRVINNDSTPSSDTESASGTDVVNF